MSPALSELFVCRAEWDMYPNASAQSPKPGVIQATTLQASQGEEIMRG